MSMNTLMLFHPETGMILRAEDCVLVKLHEDVADDADEATMRHVMEIHPEDIVPLPQPEDVRPTYVKDWWADVTNRQLVVTFMDGEQIIYRFGKVGPHEP